MTTPSTTLETPMIHRTGLLGRRWRLVVLFVATVFGLASVVISPALAGPPAGAATKPTVVLVHGALADASSWNGVISRLEGAGYPVVAVADPLRTVAGDSAYLRSVLTNIGGPIILVGHSYGGVVITNAAAGIAAVKALVYVDAFVPALGESTSGLLAMFPGSEIPTAVVPRPFTNPDGSGSADLYLDRGKYREVFAADVAEHTTDLMAVTQRPLAVDAASGTTAATAWTNIPSWYLIGSEDHAIPPATQRFMAERAHAHIVTVAASHASPVSHPHNVEQLIVGAADATR